MAMIDEPLGELVDMYWAVEGKRYAVVVSRSGLHLHSVHAMAWELAQRPRIVCDMYFNRRLHAAIGKGIGCVQETRCKALHHLAEMLEGE